MSTKPSADIFCTVVDNYGDAAIAWGIARQLATEHNFTVQLFIDKPDTLAPLAPSYTLSTDRQTIDGVQVFRWPEQFPPFVIPADLVIEVLAASAPESYVRAAANRAPKPPVWIIYEYLSAEKWVDAFHKTVSPHPVLPLIRHYFYPGVTSRTGGLLAASDYFTRRDAYMADKGAKNAFWDTLNTPEPDKSERRISFFGYENPKIPEFLQKLAASTAKTGLIVPESRLSNDVSAFFGTEIGDKPKNSGNLTVYATRMLPRTSYEHLLWACDLNFVRGEDSMTAGLLSGKPLIWHIYPQDDDAHFNKLDEFCDFYTATAPADIATAIRDLMFAWNGRGDIVPAWATYDRNFTAIQENARKIATQLGQIGNAVNNMVDFYREIG